MCKKFLSVILAIILCILCTFPASATRLDSELGLTVFPQESYLPNNGIRSFHTEHRANNTNDDYEVNSQYITVYGFDYTQQSLKYGSWRNGASGGSDDAAIDLEFNRESDISFNISVTATVTGEYTSINKKTIGGELGVTLGGSKTYTLGSGVSTTVPQYKRYLIKYRPAFYTYKVVETEYLEAYLPGIGWDRHEVGTKTCYVDVFSHWDFTVIDITDSVLL